MDPVIIAYTFSKKKQRGFYNALNEAARSDPRVRLVALSDLGASCRPHAVIHKHTEDMVAAYAGDVAAAKRVHSLERVFENEAVISVDPIAGVWRLIDRKKMAEAIDSALRFSVRRERQEKSGAYRGSGSRSCMHRQNVPHDECSSPIETSMRQLAWTLISLNSGESTIRKALEGMRFPLIVKRRSACGTKASHEIAIAFNMAGLLAAGKHVFSPDNNTVRQAENGVYSSAWNTIGDEVIAQEFLPDHGGILFKVYAIANHVVVQARSSVRPNLESAEDGYYFFDSQKLNKSSTFSFDATTRCNPDTEAIMPPRDLIARLVAAVQRELGLSLIGIDLVFDVHSKRYAVVDINYFPGYKGVDRAYEWLLSHICNQVEAKQQVNLDDGTKRTIPHRAAGIMEVHYGNIENDDPGHCVNTQNEPYVPCSSIQAAQEFELLCHDEVRSCHDYAHPKESSGKSFRLSHNRENPVYSPQTQLQVLLELPQR